MALRGLDLKTHFSDLTHPIIFSQCSVGYVSHSVPLTRYWQFQFHDFPACLRNVGRRFLTLEIGLQLINNLGGRDLSITMLLEPGWNCTESTREDLHIIRPNFSFLDQSGEFLAEFGCEGVVAFVGLSSSSV